MNTNVTFTCQVTKMDKEKITLDCRIIPPTQSTSPPTAQKPIDNQQSRQGYAISCSPCYAQGLQCDNNGQCF